MKMSKIQQRLNDKLLLVLADVEQEARDTLSGFTELSHTVAFDCFPGSLLVNCAIDNQDNLSQAHSEKAEKKLQKVLHKKLFRKGILLKQPEQNLKLVLAAQ
ncbi:hypothetical protein [Pseudoalteromonas ulvae]|uniref:Uncharacterized protein n=1 Tax=Pseudoalteromonas ulvae TaxID=107327 RepID=A0A244CVJ4_PSEDV|nr:hypothetical protein [Pseudoalteromonas ulvae]OUL59650.1 hypothetical protein B1199_05300 [Pseudoalteromonas ulvae]